MVTQFRGVLGGKIAISPDLSYSIFERGIPIPSLTNSLYRLNKHLENVKVREGEEYPD